MTGISRVQTVFIVWLCVVLLVVQSGCATHRTSAQPSLQLGKVGVVSARYTPAMEFELPAKGWLGGAGRGAVGGMKAFIMLVPLGAVGGGVGMIAFNPALVLLSAAALIAGSGYLIVGPFYGAAKAETPATVEEAEAHLKAALASMRIQETMRDHVVQAAQSLAKRDLTVLEGQGPENPSDLLTYLPVQDTTIDTVLELRVNRVWLSTNQSTFKSLDNMESPSKVLQINPPLSLGMEVRGRLIRTADKVVLYDNTWQHEGASYLFTDWAADDAKLFGEEFDHIYHVLAKYMVTTIF